MPLSKDEISGREICNILNTYQLKGLANKIENGFQDDNARKMFIKYLKQSIRKGIQKMHDVKNLELWIDNQTRDGIELTEQLKKIKDKAGKIVEMKT